MIAVSAVDEFYPSFLLIMSHSNRNPSSHHRLDTTASFFDQLKFTLENYRTPALIGAESPLAQPYFLGQVLHGMAEATTGIGRGTVLCRELERAVAALWQGALPADGNALLQTALQAKEESGLCDRYYYLLLDLTYFHRFFAAPRNQSEVYGEVLHVSPRDL